jgi:catechol 2,3-dioxygenase-like lactoylglutathione lyase family enzyme
MEARIHVVTLAVIELERALSFYRDGLGLDSAESRRARLRRPPMGSRSNS